MNIGYDAKRVFNNGTGLGNYGRTLIKNLLRIGGNQLHLFSPKLKKDFAFLFKNEQTFIHTNQQKYLADSIFRSMFIPTLPISKELEIYHGLSAELPWTEFRKAKKVVTIHDLIYLTYPQDHNRFDRWIYYQKTKHALDAADLIIATSNHTKNDILNTFKIHEDKVCVHYQSCDEQFFEPLPNSIQSELKPYFLYLGSIRPRKNLLTIVKAFNVLYKQNKDIRLIIVGTGGKYKDEIVNYAVKAGILDALEFKTTISIESLKKLLLNAKALVYPSLYEGFGIPIVEAFLTNTPVIASKRSSLPEVGNRYASYLDNPESVEEMKQALNSALNNTLVSIEDRVQARDYAMRTFNATVTSNNLLAIYSRALKI